MSFKGLIFDAVCPFLVAVDDGGGVGGVRGGGRCPGSGFVSTLLGCVLTLLPGRTSKTFPSRTLLLPEPVHPVLLSQSVPVHPVLLSHNRY